MHWIYIITQQGGSFAVPFLPLPLNKMQDRKGYRGFISFVDFSPREQIPTFKSRWEGILGSKSQDV